jgi:hypothetical protein
MAGQTVTTAPDLFYDLVSIQYHALKGAHTYDKYLRDAQGHADVAEFVRQIKDEDARRAMRCHELLIELTRRGAGM